MRHKKLLWSLLLLICYGLAGLKAQNTMFVKEKSGTQTPFTFASINNLTFTTGNMTVNKKDGSTNAYALTNIRYLNFEVVSSISEMNGDGSSNMTLFPNPVLDQLYIRYESVSTRKVQLLILDVQGRVIQQQSISAYEGTNYIAIPATKLQHGLYLCRLQDGFKFESTKFMKH